MRLPVCTEHSFLAVRFESINIRALLIIVLSALVADRDSDRQYPTAGLDTGVCDIKYGPNTDYFTIGVGGDITLLVGFGNSLSRWGGYMHPYTVVAQ